MPSANYRGFLPNTHDTKIMSSYVDENFPNGLKQNSKKWLGYDQTTYAEATTLTGPISELRKGGKVVKDEHYVDIEAVQKMTPKKREKYLADRGFEDIADAIHANRNRIISKQYKMNELTANEVYNYGIDDTICTAALYNIYQTIMEIEGTFGIYKEVEVKPAYMTALAYTQGIKISVERLKELEKEDDAVFEQARITFEKHLLEQRVLDRMWEPATELTAAIAKDCCETLFGFRPETMVRSLDKLAMAIKIEAGVGDDNSRMNEFCAALARGDLKFINGMMLHHYKANPAIDMDSPKQMQVFLYDILKLPVRVVSKVTPSEREKKKDLAKALYKYMKFMMKGETPDLDEEELKHLRTKAKTDDTAIDFALLFDAQGWVREVLEAMKTMKTISTRRKFYYRPYPAFKHWKDGKLHPNINQCATVTRRYSSSAPNVQQMPKKGEGVKIRSVIKPHHKNAVVVSLDFNGQELRLIADQSQDANMLACYVGDRLKDIHSITASGAMEKKWGKDKLDKLVRLIQAEYPITSDDFYDVFVKLRKHSDKAIAKMADDLRKVAKNVNFGSNYDSGPLTLSETIIMPVADVIDFLDAKYAMFPRVETWKDEVRAEVERLGYATTMMGARRHLGRLLMDKATANKAGRQGPNFKIQSSAAEMTKLAMARVWDSGVLFDYDCVFYAPVHDELVLSVDRNDALDAIRIIHECMTAQYSDMKVPALSSISIGPDFGHQIECSERNGGYDAEEIEKALIEIFGEWRKPALGAA